LLFGSLGAALVSGARQGTVLLALLVLPLYSPVLIFTAGAIDLHRTSGVANGNAQTPLLLLLSMLAIALPAVPLACGAMLRGQIKN
jgi:heme exporter protein B